MTDIQKLIKKRARLDAEIEKAKKAEARKIEILKLLEDAKILHLPDDILKGEFERIALDSQPAD